MLHLFAALLLLSSDLGKVYGSENIDTLKCHSGDADSRGIKRPSLGDSNPRPQQRPKTEVTVPRNCLADSDDPIGDLYPELPRLPSFEFVAPPVITRGNTLPVCSSATITEGLAQERCAPPSPNLLPPRGLHYSLDAGAVGCAGGVGPEKAESPGAQDWTETEEDSEEQ